MTCRLPWLDVQSSKFNPGSPPYQLDMSNPLKCAQTDSSSRSHRSGGSHIVNTSPSTEWHHPNLWFKDGSIVIRAQETLFKAYQGLLTSHSPVFSSMFSIPQPCDQEIIEGCPVVDVPDNANDFTRLLRAIYEPT